ncbi:MAG TPA: holin [bacterium]|nr:holin [bacterium]
MQEKIIVGRLQSIFSWPITKLVSAFFITLIAPIYAALIGLLVLVIIDFFLGIWRAVKEVRFSSARMRTGVSKIILYCACILTVRLGEQQIYLIYGKEILYISEFTILFFSATEIASILETISKLGVKVPGSILSFFEKQADMKRLGK